MVLVFTPGNVYLSEFHRRWISYDGAIFFVSITWKRWLNQTIVDHEEDSVRHNQPTWSD